jgi:PAS domain S-box-containing protein
MNLDHHGQLVLDERTFDAVLNRVSDGVTVQDTAGQLVYANPAAVEMIGFESLGALLTAPAEERMARFKLLREDGEPMSLEQLPGRRGLLGETASAVVRYVVQSSGEERFSLVRAEPIFADDGSVAFAVNTFTDVTESKRNERRLRLLANAGAMLSASLDYEETLQRVAKLAVPELADWCVIDVFDEAGELQRVATYHADPAKVAIAAELMRRRPTYSTNVQGPYHVARSGVSRVASVLNDDQLREVAAIEGWDDEYSALIQQLGLRAVILAPLHGHDRVLGVLMLVSAESGRNYGDHDLAMAELLARRAGLAVENSLLYREARHAIEARDRFLALAAHELLTPVTIVRGYTETLERAVRRAMEHAPDAERVSLDAGRLRRSIGHIDLASDRLTRLIHDLLDISRLQRGTLGLSPEPMDLSALVRSALESVQLQQAEGRYGSEIALEADLPAEGRVVGRWDPVRLEQVLFNVLDNAMKYSEPHGVVRVALSVEGEMAQLAVSDRGIGIAPDQVETIFEPFHRTKAAGEQAVGFGMGLAVCREIVRGHGGSITAESAGEHQGTTVRITLPGARLVAPAVDMAALFATDGSTSELLSGPAPSLQPNG